MKIKKIILILIVSLFLNLKLILKMFNLSPYYYLGDVASYFKIFPYPVVFHEDKNIESYAFKIDFLINNEKKISLNNNLSKSSCTHKQLISELIPFFYLDNIRQNLNNNTKAVLCYSTCISQHIKKELDINNISSYKINIKTLKGLNFNATGTCI